MKVTAQRRKGYAHSLTAGHHTLVADEPQSSGGTDTGPSPTQMLALSLASCTAITLEAYADRKQWEVGHLTVDVEYELNRDGKSRFELTITLPPALSEDQVAHLRVIAGKCLVHRALKGQVEITNQVARG